MDKFEKLVSDVFDKTYVPFILLGVLYFTVRLFFFVVGM